LPLTRQLPSGAVVVAAAIARCSCHGRFHSLLVAAATAVSAARLLACLIAISIENMW